MFPSTSGLSFCERLTDSFEAEFLGVDPQLARWQAMVSSLPTMKTKIELQDSCLRAEISHFEMDGEGTLYCYPESSEGLCFIPVTEIQSIGS
ncbi:MAG: hypothetical protein AAFU85_15960 [Planctomycetota bacterium]